MSRFVWVNRVIHIVLFSILTSAFCLKDIISLQCFKVETTYNLEVSDIDFDDEKNGEENDDDDQKKELDKVFQEIDDQILNVVLNRHKLSRETNSNFQDCYFFEIHLPPPEII